MKSKIAWSLWALAPFLAWVWLSGPGDAARRAERTQAQLDDARLAELKEDWSSAVERYDDALGGELSAEEERAVRLARARASAGEGEMWPAIEQLEALMLEADDSDREAVRSELAMQRYFMAWLMRLEGGEREEWFPESELAREHFRLLSETADPSRSVDYAKNVEAVLRLQQMDLNELMALPLPKNCSCNCKGGLCKNKSKAKAGKCRAKGGKRPSDSRETLNTQSAGATRAFGSGS